VIFKTDRRFRLDQLTEELRALPGLASIDGLSACGPSAGGESEITVHVGDLTLSADQQRAIIDAIACHVSDPRWGVSAEKNELTAILARGEGSLSLLDVERALRLLARTVEQQSPGAAATAEIDGVEQ
jgi:hypothetical protein